MVRKFEDYVIAADNARSKRHILVISIRPPMKLALRLLFLTLCALPLAQCSERTDHEPTGDEKGIDVTGAWAAATPPGASTAAAYLKIANTGETDDRLIRARTDVADWVEFHNHAYSGGKMVMEPIPAVAIPSGEAVIFEPHGRHLMLFGLQQPLEPGGSLELTLVLEEEGEMTLTVLVRDIRP